MKSSIKTPLRIGNAQGFWGDRPTAAAQLIHQQPDLDYITLDYLAEVSLSIMAIQQQKDPNAGYAKDFINTLRSLLPFWKEGLHFKVVTNAGGLNPLGLAKACRQILEEENFSHLKIGVVEGDNVLEVLKQDGEHSIYKNLNTEQSLEIIKSRLVTANAYLGASPIVDVLKAGADIVITGRLADPSLTVAPCIVHFEKDLTDYDFIAQATVAGHLIECGSQVTGGVTTNWFEHFATLDAAANLGFPFVEMVENGSFVITKPKHSGGRVDEQSVKEQLLYEIGNPEAYLSPDATVSFLSLQLTEDGLDRIRINSARGKAPPDTYKVSATYKDGYRTECMLAIFGPEAVTKAKACGEIILKRVAEAGYSIERSHIECLGSGDVVGQTVPSDSSELLECVLRVAVADPRKEALECFTKEIAPLITSGPQGITGYTSGRPHIREIFSFWPCLIERAKVHPRIEMV